MFLSIENLVNDIKPTDEPDPNAANDTVRGSVWRDENYDAISLSEL